MTALFGRSVCKSIFINLDPNTMNSVSYLAVSSRANQLCHFFLYVIFFALPTSKSLLYIAIFGFLTTFTLAGNWLNKFKFASANRIIWLFLVVYGIVLFGCLYGPGTLHVQQNYLQYYGKLLLGGVIVCQLTGQPKLQHQALHAFTLAMALTAAISILKWQGLVADDITHLLGSDPADNAGFKDYLIQNVMMGMFVVTCIAGFVASIPSDKAARMIWLVGIVLGLTALFIAVERGRTGQLGFLAGLVLIAASTIRPSRWVAALVAIVALLLITYYFHEAWRLHIHRALIEAFNYKANPLSSVGNRIYLYDWAINFTRGNDFFSYLIGNGTGSYPVFAHASFDQAMCDTSCPHPHSQFIFFWIEYGLIGLSALVAMFTYLIILTTSTQKREAKILLSGFIGIFLIDSVFHSSLWLRMEGFFAALMMALLTTYSFPPSASVLNQSIPNQV